MRGRAWVGELRTWATGVDPGWGRLRFAGVATAAMALAVLLMSGVRALSGQPITVVLFAAVLAMVSNLSVTEPELGRRRVTTALMVLPAAASTVVGTLLVEHRTVSDVVFVLVMMVAVVVRRFGARGTALGMALFMPYFFTQFLQARPEQLPWLLAAVGVGIGSTLLLRGFVFADDPEKILDRLTVALRAHVHALALAVVDVLEAPAQDRAKIDDALRDVARRRTRLNDTMLQVADQFDRLDRPADESRELQLADLELAAERLAVSTRRLADDPARPGALEPEVRRALIAGARGIAAGTATGIPDDSRAIALAGARRSVDPLAAEHGGARPREQRLAFAVVRLADALEGGGDHPPPAPVEVDQDAEPEEETTDGPKGLALSTRQAVQVGVATSLAIVAGELVSPARWYWAVIAAFVVFAGTASRGDVLTRGWQRLVGTVGGVVAGMGLALLVGGHVVVSLVLLACCVFLALYLVRISTGLLAFWITAVLALLYGVIGQFSVETLVLRVVETAVGGALGALAGFLVLPKHTREAFREALDETVDALDDTLAATTDRLLGRPAAGVPVELARVADEKLKVLRERARPLDSPLPRRRGRGSYQRALRVLTAVDHYARSFARLSDGLVAPEWTALDPAVAAVRANLAALGEVLAEQTPEVRSAEQLVDEAEAAAATTEDPARRTAMLTAARLVRRIDQVVVRLVDDLAGVPAGTSGQRG
ncbi:FUSC family protein [Pseudonocardia sp. WMMC193]|uniref:FUSC family protein n=1 Tax=Pseudonocardia sp. WMMC193 TaxID=2911965 RepID=UPI001F34986C|nr:FUSC family protein [Pseudonocardia sp. WMMC193]MCF7548998.1 FUSC family protein [Pseudonocardia sp. WMMC193]